MNKMQYTISAMIFGFSLLVSPFITNAQDVPVFSKEQQEIFNTLSKEDQERVIKLGPPSAIGGGFATGQVGTVNCFDYYKFGSVQVDLSPTLVQTLPGMPLTFTGKLKNENPYPLVNGSVYVKIFKINQIDEEKNHQNGYPLIAFFEAGKDIVIPENSEKEYTFDWKVPAYLQGGEYEAHFFFVTDYRFNLLGLSFTDDVTGNRASFHITDTVNNQVVFEKNTVALNDTTYRFAGFPPHFTADEPVIVSATLINPDNITKEVTLTWQLYNWDGLRSDFLLDTRTESVMLKANEERVVTYTATARTGTVSYIIGTVNDGDAKSIINPRFVRDGIEEVRLNFPSILSYPLESGKENALFSCLHSTNLPVVKNGSLTLSLTDADTSEVIHAYTYTGDITGAMMGVKDSFTPTYTPRRMTLTTTLIHNNKTIDTVSQTYDCALLNPENCPEVQRQSVTTDDHTKPSPVSPFVLISVLILLLILIGLGIFMKRRNESSVNNTDTI